MENKVFKATAIGSRADIQAGVDISKVHGGYFSSAENARVFCEVGIQKIENDLPREMSYVDFGGGQGFLADLVSKYLEQLGHLVKVEVVDGNEGYLKVAGEIGLSTRLGNLELVEYNDIDLVTMRAVLHYNLPSVQQEIVKNIYRALNPGGYFVHQLSAARSKANNQLRADLVNIPALGRDGSGSYNWISENDAVKLHELAGFSETMVVGEAPGGSWGPLSQWERFNAGKGDEGRKAQYLREAQAVIDDYRAKYSDEETGLEKLADGSFVVHYEYPILVSRK